MAVAIDSQMAAAAGAHQDRTTNGTFTYSFTNTAGTLLIVTVSIAHGSATDNTISGVTYNGVSMTQKGSASVDGSSRVRVYHFYLQSPATGANNVVITPAGTTGTGMTISGATSWTGAKTGDPYLQYTPNTTASAATLDTTLTSVATGSACIDAQAMGAPTTAGNQTTTWTDNVDSNTAGDEGRSQYNVGSTGSVLFTANCSSSDTITIAVGEIGADTGAGVTGMYWVKA